MQSLVVDQSSQLTSGHLKCVTNLPSAFAGCARVQTHRYNARRAVRWAFTCKALPATLARNHLRSQTRVLRCAAGKHVQDPQTARASLQRQVDRLTSLLATLQAATTWHDKVGSGICPLSFFVHSTSAKVCRLQVLALQNEPGIQAFFDTYQ